MSEIIQLFSTFFKIGAFTFGGGYAMIPLIEREVVEKNKYLTSNDISDIIAIAEATPGPIAINVATFTGYRIAGVKGAIASTLGVVIPSFVIIVLISLLFKKYMNNQIIENAFWGVRISVLALMIKALLNIYKQCPKKALSYIVAVVAFVAVGLFNISALIIIAVAAVVGIVYQQIAGKI